MSTQLTSSPLQRDTTSVLRCASYTRSSSTSPFSSFSSLTLASILLRLKSFNDTFGTIFQASPTVRMGNELIRPFLDSVAPIRTDTEETWVPTLAASCDFALF